MPAYYLTGKLSADGFALVLKNSARSLEARLKSLLQQHDAVLTDLFFLGSDFDPYIIVDAAPVVTQSLMVALINNGLFAAGLSAGRLITAEDADSAIDSAPGQNLGNAVR